MLGMQFGFEKFVFNLICMEINFGQLHLFIHYFIIYRLSVKQGHKVTVPVIRL